MYKAYIGDIIEYMGRVGRPLTTNEIKDFLNETTSVGASSSEVKSTLRLYRILFRKVDVVRIRSTSGCYNVETWTLAGKVDELKKILRESNVRTLRQYTMTLSDKPAVDKPATTATDDEDDDDDEHEPILVEYDEDDDRLDINGNLKRKDGQPVKEEEPDPILMPKPFRRQRRVKWTDEMDVEFVRYRLVDNLSEADIAMKMNLRIAQVKGRIKRLERGKMPKAIMQLQKDEKKD